MTDCSLVFAEFMTVDTMVVGCTDDSTSVDVSGSCEEVVACVSEDSVLEVLDG